MKALQGYRTLAVSVLMIVSGQLQANTELVPQAWAGMVVTVLGVVIAALRFDTKGPVGKPQNGAS